MRSGRLASQRASQGGVGVALPVGFGHGGAVHAVVGGEAAGEAEVGAGADDFGGARGGGVEEGVVGGVCGDGGGGRVPWVRG